MTVNDFDEKHWKSRLQPSGICRCIEVSVKPSLWRTVSNHYLVGSQAYHLKISSTSVHLQVLYLFGFCHSTQRWRKLLGIQKFNDKLIKYIISKLLIWNDASYISCVVITRSWVNSSENVCSKGFPICSSEKSACDMCNLRWKWHIL